MTTVTVRAVLLGDADPARALAASAGWRGVVDGLGGALGQVSAGGRQVVEREMSAAVAGLLGLDLGDVLLAGWRRHRALHAAAEATQGNPGAVEVVQLATHRITTGHRPYVDIVLNGATVATVHFDLSLDLDVDGVLGTVKEGKLMSLQGGRCTVSAGLSCLGKELVSRQVAIDPVVAVNLGQGVSLLQTEQARR
jgi:hypothetical protein